MSQSRDTKREIRRPGRLNSRRGGVAGLKEIHQHQSVVNKDQTPIRTLRDQTLKDFEQAYELLATEDDVVGRPEVEEEEREGSAAEKCRSRGMACLNSIPFYALTALLIIVQGVVIGLETDDPSQKDYNMVENFLLSCFTFELLARFLVYGLRAFCDQSNPDALWNKFDVCIVAVGFLDNVYVWLQGSHAEQTTVTLFRCVRLMRLLRVFRLLRFAQRLYVLAYGFVLAVVAVFWVSCLLGSLLYVCSIILVRTLGHLPDGDPDAPFFHSHFGSIRQAMFTLFQLAVQPDLTAYEEMATSRPLVVIFLVFFIMFGSFGMIALLTGVISEAMFEKNILKAEEAQIERNAMFKNIARAVSEIYDSIDKSANGEATVDDLQKVVHSIARVFEDNGLSYTQNDLICMLKIMDTKKSNTISRSEFCRGILQVAEDVRPMLIMELHYDSMVYMSSLRQRLEHCESLTDKILHRQDDELNSSQLRDITTKQIIQESHDELAALIRGAFAGPRHDAASRRLQRGFSMESMQSIASSSLGLHHDYSTGQDTVRTDTVRRGSTDSGRTPPLSCQVSTQSSHAPPSHAPPRRQLTQQSAVTQQSVAMVSSLRTHDSDEASEAKSAVQSPKIEEVKLWSQSHAHDAEVKAMIAKLHSDVRALQGALLGVSGRMEEHFSEQGREWFTTKLGEISSQVSSPEMVAAVAKRVGECEFAVKQAYGMLTLVHGQAHELTHQLKELRTHHVQSCVSCVSCASTKTS